ncbi:DsbA family oxidoreductase [Paraburkholderia tagetis]|uniref:DsbA family oxidoreductase n=1 Tax=Paraburkholderia tagetis TaxID=2913261 RepID=A0A9X1UPG1_9BURK|nr:DsbA family oxidoreductase [Paraburkholderia tagetis]MCG5078937.1 DsbA family oxidoreductase [Paraburkholderia tagetis]
MTHSLSPASPGSPARLLRVDFHFDFICPWCLIGKRNLEAAIAALEARQPHMSVQVVWHPLELLPHTPPGGLPYEAFYLARLGSAQAVAQRRAQVRQAAHSAGVELAFERIRVMPNTAAAHELVARATDKDGERGRGLQAELIERLFSAYFVEGEDIGDAPTLSRIARAYGVDDAAPAPRVDGASLRVDGVPFFVFEGRYAVSGAQPPQVLVDAMLRAVELAQEREHEA